MFFSLRIGAKVEEKPASRADREKLAELIHLLASEQLGNIVTTISKSCPEAVSEEDDEELEVELNKLDGSTLATVLQYAQECQTANASSSKRKR